MSALMRFTDSSLTSRHVRKVPAISGSRLHLLNRKSQAEKVLSDAGDRGGGAASRVSPTCGRCGNCLLRPLDPAAAAAQVAEAVGLVLPGLGQFRQAAEHVALREIPLSVAVILLSHAEVLSGFTNVIVVVVVMVTMAAVATLVTLATEETTQHTAHHISNERCCKTCESEHSAFSILIRVPAPTQCQTLGALLFFVPTNRNELRAADHGCLADDVRQKARELSISRAKKTLG